MRYPRPHRHQAQHRLLILLGAFFVFSLGLIGAHSKLRQPLEASQLAPLPKISQSPVQETTKLQFFRLDDFTLLVNTPIQLRAEQFCTTTTPCQAASPILYTTDASGSIAVPTEIVEQQPIIAVDGYVKDSYFTFLNKTLPSELTLYKVPGEIKRSYDIHHEIIPIYLEPLP